MALCLRILKGAMLGTLLGLAIGIGIAWIVLLIAMSNEAPMDRWQLGTTVTTLVLASSTLVGLVAGVASKVPENGLSLLKSLMFVAAGGIAAIAFAPGVKSGFFLLAPLVGIIVGGIVVVGLGILVKCQNVPGP